MSDAPTGDTPMLEPTPADPEAPGRRRSTRGGGDPNPDIATRRSVGDAQPSSCLLGTTLTGLLLPGTPRDKRVPRS